MRNFITTILLIACTASTALPQEQDARRTGRRGGRAAPQQRVDHRHRLLREWRQIRKTLTNKEKRDFSRMSRKEKRRFMRERQKRHQRSRRRQNEKLYLENLEPETRQAILGLPENERTQAILGLRVDRRLAKLLDEARRRDIVTDAEAHAIAADKNLRNKAEAALDLQKTIFLDTFSAAIGEIPVRRRGELLALEPSEFFKRPEIKRLPVIRFFDLRRVKRAIRSSPGLVSELELAQASGELTVALERLLRKGRVHEFRALSAQDRKASIRQLRGMPVFSTGNSTKSRGRTRQGRQRRPTLRDFLRRFERQSEERQRRMMGMPVQRAFERLFPELRRGTDRKRGPGGRD